MSTVNSQARKLLQKQRSQRSTPRVSHPLATYDLFPGTLACQLCRIRVGEIVWGPHLNSQGHQEAEKRVEKEKEKEEERLREVEEMTRTQGPPRKRAKAEPSEPQPSEIASSAEKEPSPELDLNEAWKAFNEEMEQAEAASRLERRLQEDTSVVAAAAPVMMDDEIRELQTADLEQKEINEDDEEDEQGIEKGDPGSVETVTREEEEEEEKRGQARLRDRLEAMKAQRAALPHGLSSSFMDKILPGTNLESHVQDKLEEPKEEMAEDEEEDEEDADELDRMMDWRAKRVY
ncbi:MAG: hypothetical protein DHS80DRAFT_31609 [Piptocephalis tieghemiana]|nr:MAG: hypothetical protein DHS80DRAFT_31609 [Piptocephalis tieghemiana]